MRKLLISASIASVLGLAGCGSETIEDVRENTPVERPASRMVFDPAAGVLPIPTDLLLAVVQQTQDGTLEVPDEVAQGAVGDIDYTDPGVVLGALDGWSPNFPFSLSTTHPAGITLDATSVATPGSVRVFKGSIGGDINDADCATQPPLTGCKIEEELTFGVDFVTQASGNDIQIIPLKPWEEATSYYIAVTTGVTGSDGQPVAPSTSYESLSQDINEFPLSTESQLALQGLINSYEAVLASQGGVSQDSIIFSATVTTQVADTIYNTHKGVQIAPFAQALAAGLPPEQAAQFLPVIPVGEGIAPTAYEVLGPTILGAETWAGLSAVGLDSCTGLTAALADPTNPLFPTASQVFAQAGPFCAASLKSGSVNLPYYLSTEAPLTEWWNAACTNGLAILTIGPENIPGLIESGAIGVGPNNDLCQAATGGTLLDLDLTNLGINDYRHVTRYSPVLETKGRNADGTETLQVQITVPDENIVNLIASLNPAISPITKPEAGWPVVVLGHGITSKKEDFLAISGALSLAGFATAAIDFPIHGSRGFVMEDGTIINASGGFGGSTTDYFNLTSLLTARDNNRQGIVDILGLRLGLNAVVDTTGGSVQIDGSNAFYVGQSLGSILGSSAVNAANTSLAAVNPALAPFDAMYQFKGVSLGVPGGGIAGFLLESPSFGPLVKGSLLFEVSTDFQQFVIAFAQENGIPVEQAIAPAYLAFEAAYPEVIEQVQPVFNEFTFVAQTVLDSSDPINMTSAIVDTPVHMIEQVGGGVNDDGSTALPDQVIPNTTSLPLSGTEPLAAVMGLQGVSSTTPGRGLVRFITGSHSSLLSPSPSAAATLEQQAQVAAYLQSTLLGQPTIVITNEDVVQN